MAKKKAKESDPLGKLVAAGEQKPRRMALVVLGGVAVVVGLGLAGLGLAGGGAWVWVGTIAGGLLVLLGAGVIRANTGFLPIQFEVRKRGIRYATPHRELELGWDELDSVFVQMITTNVLLNFTGVGDAGDYILKRGDSMPFQVKAKTKEGQHFTFTSGMLPPMTGHAVLNTIAENMPTTGMAYQLFAVLPKLPDGDS